MISWISNRVYWCVICSSVLVPCTSKMVLSLPYTIYSTPSNRNFNMLSKSFAMFYSPKMAVTFKFLSSPWKNGNSKTPKSVIAEQIALFRALLLLADGS